MAQSRFVPLSNSWWECWHPLIVAGVAVPVWALVGLTLSAVPGALVIGLAALMFLLAFDLSMGLAHMVAGDTSLARDIRKDRQRTDCIDDYGLEVTWLACASVGTAIAWLLVGPYWLLESIWVSVTVGCIACQLRHGRIAWRMAVVTSQERAKGLM